MSLTVVARIKAKAGKENEVREALMALIAPTHAEEGCINYDLHVSTDEPGVFLFHENWTSREALDEHLQKPHLVALAARSDELLESLEITTWNKIG
jgi:quinol monooxygenase YgiN